MSADIAAGVALRLFFFYATPLRSILECRLELSTPFTSIVSVREARAIGSYEKLSPLLITALQYLNHPLFWVSLDAAAAYTLMGISKRCARFYIYNPLIILTTLAQSCVSVQNALILSALSMAYQKRALAALCLLSLASVLFMYPAALLPPLIMVLLGDTSWTAATVIRLVSVFVTSTISAVSLCRYIAADWSFVNLYKSLILVDDLTPNTGLFWYLLVEMFEQFKPFFTMVLQIHTVIYVPSVCIFLSHRPTLAFAFLAGTLAVFKSYPCMGDVGVLVTLLPLFSDLFAHARHPVFVAAVTTAAAGLLPLFRYLWLRVVTGNANFYYASTLLWTFSNGLILTELLYAEARRQFVSELDSAVDLTKYEIRQV